jgi:hypothetical protein
MTLPSPLRSAEIAEIAALRRANDRLGGPSFVRRFHWQITYRRLVRRGLVAWGAPPAGFDRRRWAGTTITNAGRVLLTEMGPEADRVLDEEMDTFDREADAITFRPILTNVDDPLKQRGTA